jgi:hypothetical protein
MDPASSSVISSLTKLRDLPNLRASGETCRKLAAAALDSWLAGSYRPG